MAWRGALRRPSGRARERCSPRGRCSSSHADERPTRRARRPPSPADQHRSRCCGYRTRAACPRRPQNEEHFLRRIALPIQRRTAIPAHEPTGREQVAELGRGKLAEEGQRAVGHSGAVTIREPALGVVQAARPGRARAQQCSDPLVGAVHGAASVVDQAAHQVQGRRLQVGAQQLEVAAAEPVTGGLRHGGRRRRSQSAIEQRHFTEQLARAHPEQRERRVARHAGAHFDRSGSDHVEAVGFVALPEQDLVRFQSERTDHPREVLELLRGQPLEER